MVGRLTRRQTWLVGIILLFAWRASSVTSALLVSLVIVSVIMAAVGVLACAAPARRALRIQPTEALRQG